MCLFTVSVLVVSAKGQMPDNVGDILQSLKDSGMMDKFEQDLKQMLFEQVKNSIFIINLKHRCPSWRAQKVFDVFHRDGLIVWAFEEKGVNIFWVLLHFYRNKVFWKIPLKIVGQTVSVWPDLWLMSNFP